MTSKNEFKNLQHEIEKWLNLRKKVSSLAQNIVNLINQSSYTSNNKMNNSFHDVILPSKMSAIIYDEISIKTENLHELQNDMLKCLKQINVIQFIIYPNSLSNNNDTSIDNDNDSNRNNDSNNKNDIIDSNENINKKKNDDKNKNQSSFCLVEFEVFDNIKKQMQQQTLLEMCIVEELCGM